MQTQPVLRLSIPMEDFGIAKSLLDNLADQPKRRRKTRFNQLRKFLLFASVIAADDTIHSIAKGLDAAGNLTVEVTLERSREKRSKPRRATTKSSR